MRTLTAPAVLLILALPGCGADAPTAPVAETPTADGALASRHASPQRPIKGHCEATTIQVQPISPTLVRRTSVGTCQLSHLGRTGLLSIAYTNLITFEQEGEHTFTAANGDQLRATSTGAGFLAPPPILHFTGVTTITGGTGRFANASGVMQVEGVSNLATATTSLSYNGWIAY